MTHRITIKEKNGYYSISINGTNVGAGMSEEKASAFRRGLIVGIEESNQSWYDDENSDYIF